MKDYIVTEIEYGEHRLLAAAFYDELKLSELTVSDPAHESMVGNIYLGVFDSYADNIGGAYLRIEGGRKVFLPSVRRGKKPSGRLVVEIVKDASGKKEAVVSAKIRIAGKYAVMADGHEGLSFSSKLDDEQRLMIGKWIDPSEYPGCQPLIRTNAAEATKEMLVKELQALYSLKKSIETEAEGAKSGALLYRPYPFYVEMLCGLYVSPDRVFTDIPAVAERLLPFDPQKSSSSDGLMPGNKTLSLSVLYNLNRDIQRLLEKNVYLKSGAYIVIEQTEAFVSIDVNTGKCLRGKIPEETYRRINLEAADEVVRQLRLRNLSGMILVDFISMESQDHKDELVGVMRKLVRHEHRKTEVIDLTPLGIMEMIRQKAEKPLAEILRG